MLQLAYGPKHANEMNSFACFHLHIIVSSTGLTKTSRVDVLTLPFREPQFIGPTSWVADVEISWRPWRGSGT